MYEPPHFQETRPDVLHGLIRAHPLGMLVSNGPDGPVANAIPFLLDAEGLSNGRLRAHLAKANPHWRLIADNPASPVLIVFQGAERLVEEVLRLAGDQSSLIRSHLATMENKF